jgi:uncharacterized protein
MSNDEAFAPLDDVGHCTLRQLITASEATALIDMFDEDARYRSTIDMARHGFGVGTYRYFAYPLPDAVEQLRQRLYAQLVPLANDWEERLGTAVSYPATLDEFTVHCAASGQVRPTPLILRYQPGHYNCLHQDRYGAVSFPFQVAILLTAKDQFDGGEFVLVEQRPRVQSRAHVISLDIGDAVVFPNQVRPVTGTRGVYRTQFRHGVSTLHSGTRHVLGLIFHDAE